MNTPELRTTSFLVHVPNLEGDGIAEIVPIEVQCFIDTETGEEVLTPESLEKIEQTKARRMGLISSDELKKLRERLDLTQEDISNLLQIGAKTYTRWESGRARPSRSMNVLLCALRDGVISLEYLRALRSGNGVTLGFARQILASNWLVGRHALFWVNRTERQEVTQNKRVEVPVRPKGRADQRTVYRHSGINLVFKGNDVWETIMVVGRNRPSGCDSRLESEENDTLDFRS